MLPVRKGDAKLARVVGAYAHVRGHPIYWTPDEDVWRYADGVVACRGWMKLPGVMEERPCISCGVEAPEIDGKYPDPCLGLLPDVEYACCGHGVERCYVVWMHGVLTVGEQIGSIEPEVPRYDRLPAS